MGVKLHFVSNNFKGLENYFKSNNIFEYSIENADSKGKDTL